MSSTVKVSAVNAGLGRQVIKVATTVVGPQGPAGQDGSSVWIDITSRPEYIDSASATVLSFSDAEKAYRIGDAENPVSTASFTISTTGEVPGITNVIHYNAATLPTITPPIGRQVLFFNQSGFSAFTDCVLYVELQPDLNYLVYVAAPIDVPNTAADVPVADTGAFYTATDVEGVLQEIGPQLGAGGASSLDDLSDVTIGTPAANTDASLRILGDPNTDGTFTVVDWTPPSAGGGITDLIQDTTPQLGGELDLNGNDIRGVGDIVLLGGTGATPRVLVGETSVGDVWGMMKWSATNDSLGFYNGIHSNIAPIFSLTSDGKIDEVNTNNLISDTATFGGASPIRAFNVFGAGFDGRVNIQGGTGDNPGLEMTTNGNTSRTLLRHNTVGTDGAELQIWSELDGGNIEQTAVFYGQDLTVSNNITGGGSVEASAFTLSALNTAPATATSTGTTGEIRVTATHIYVCTATDTWVRAALSTW